MSVESGPVLFALLLGVLLAAAVSWVIAGLYRRRMLELMRSDLPPDDQQAPHSHVTPAMEGRKPVAPDAAEHQRAARRQLLVLSGLSLLIGLTQSALALWFVYEDRSFSFNRLVILGLVYAWPMVMAWGLAWRWSWGRVLLSTLAYQLLMALVVMLGSNAQQSLLSVSGWLGGVVLVPVTVTLLIGASGRIRAIAPYLLPIFLLLAAASVAALQVLAQGVHHPAPWILTLVGVLGAWPTIVLMALAPWLVLAWPAYRLGLALAHGYRAKRFSDLGYLLAAYWFVVLAASALPALQGVGWVALTQLLPWLWLPLANRVLRGWLAPRKPPPTLLVLRVFQQDAGVQVLFDRVVERWRLSGNTVLIAGTDLLSRTLDPDDLFTFLNGQLASRFVADQEQLARRLRELDRAPDPDGRYRVNECYCFDGSWQMALAALVAQADVVLMDLRGFQARNQGCRHELEVLVCAAPTLRRVVLLYDGRTAREVAQADLLGAPAGRFVWVPADRLGSRQARDILRALMPASS